MIRVLHLDTNHHSLVDGLAALGMENVHNTSSTKEEIEQIITELRLTQEQRDKILGGGN